MSQREKRIAEDLKQYGGNLITKEHMKVLEQNETGGGGVSDNSTWRVSASNSEGSLRLSTKLLFSFRP